ncbi:MAG: DUF3108 domain-containing protein [Candidatus Eisenbacteria bacterium]|nr:DUF3108 domain-containing protein [Candidatus Latescibacterota bacterium]MBD3303452.1 DUF3108 domain-containing protein [Candidatus Eisenbacteria bacterium]
MTGAIRSAGPLLLIPLLTLASPPEPSETGVPPAEPDTSGAEPDPWVLLQPDTAGVELIDPHTRALRRARERMTAKDDAIRTGEKLIFSVRYGFIRAGEASLEITGIEEVGGHPCYHVVSLAKSNSFFDRIFKVRDRVESWMDVDFLFSRRFHKRLREGGYRKDQRIEMDHRNLLATYQNGRVFEISPGAHDVLSAFYYVRTLDLEPGQQFDLDAHADRKNYPLRVIVHRRESVDTPAGEFDCLVVEPVLRTPGLFKHQGDLTIWLTDDERRMPVLMKSKIAVGSISVTLTDWTRPE